MADKLQAHGFHHSHIINNILYIEATGPWNIEYFKVLHNDLALLLKDEKVSSFGVLLSLKGEAIGVSEAFQMHVDFLKKGTGLQAIAVNMAECETKAVTIDMCQKAYINAGIKHDFFDNLNEAKMWLLEHFD